MNLPNKITIARIVLIPFFVALYYITAIPHNLVYAAGVFALAAFTDFLDGYIARKYNLVTDLGKFLDPIADKVLVLTAFMLMLTDVNGAVLPALSGGICVSLVIAREMIVASFRMVAASKNAVIAADKLGKIKTVSQDFAILFLLAGSAFSSYRITAATHPGDFFAALYVCGFALFIFSAVMTVISGVNYIYKNRAVLKDENASAESAAHSCEKEEEIKKARQEELFKDALRLAVEKGTISISIIQRKFGIGYPRAGKLVDAMQAGGYISEPREGHECKVCITAEQFEKEFGEPFDKPADEND